MFNRPLRSEGKSDAEAPVRAICGQPVTDFPVTNVSGVTARAAAPVTPIVLPHARQVSRRVDGVVHASS